MMVQDLDEVVDLTETEGTADVVQATLQVGNQKKHAYSFNRSLLDAALVSCFLEYHSVSS